MISATCSVCGLQHVAEDDRAGTTFRCGCKETIRFPDPAIAEKPRAPAPVRIACPSCGKEFGVPLTALGSLVKCLDCDAAFVATVAPPKLPPVVQAAQEPQPKRLRNCPDCGSFVSKAASACPKCGRPMGRQKQRPGEVTCPLCGAKGEPIYRKKMTPGGYIFVVLCLLFGIVFWPLWLLAPLGALVTTARPACRSCGIAFEK